MNINVKSLAVGLLLTVAANFAAAQRPPVTVLEASVETVADRVLFPSSLSGKIQIVDCRTCSTPLFAIDANTRFNLAGKNVGLKEMAAYARGSGAVGKSMTVHYRLSDSVVSLVSVLSQ